MGLTHFFSWLLCDCPQAGKSAERLFPFTLQRYNISFLPVPTCIEKGLSMRFYAAWAIMSA